MRSDFRSVLLAPFDHADRADRGDRTLPRRTLMLTYALSVYMILFGTVASLWTGLGNEIPLVAFASLFVVAVAAMVCLNYIAAAIGTDDDG